MNILVKTEQKGFKIDQNHRNHSPFLQIPDTTGVIRHSEKQLCGYTKN